MQQARFEEARADGAGAWAGPPRPSRSSPSSSISACCSFPSTARSIASTCWCRRCARRARIDRVGKRSPQRLRDSSHRFLPESSGSGATAGVFDFLGDYYVAVPINAQRTEALHSANLFVGLAVAKGIVDACAAPRLCGGGEFSGAAWSYLIWQAFPPPLPQRRLVEARVLDLAILGAGPRPRREAPVDEARSLKLFSNRSPANLESYQT